MADLPTGILNSENSLTSPSREIIVADVVATAKENASASASAIVAVEDNVEDNAEDNSSCAKKRKFTSVVWNEFKVVTLKDKSQKAECMHCKSHFAYTKGGVFNLFVCLIFLMNIFFKCVWLCIGFVEFQLFCNIFF